MAATMSRAIATAQATGQRCGVAVTVDASLTEIDYGAWDGLSADTVDRDDHDAFVRWTADPAWHAPTSGETAVALARRMLGVVERIRRESPVARQCSLLAATL